MIGGEMQGKGQEVVRGGKGPVSQQLGLPSHFSKQGLGQSSGAKHTHGSAESSIPGPFS